MTCKFGIKSENPCKNKVKWQSVFEDEKWQEWGNYYVWCDEHRTPNSVGILEKYKNVTD